MMLALSVQGRLRAGRQKDAARLSEIFSESWSQAYPGIIPRKDLDMLIERRTKSWWNRTLMTQRNILVSQTNDDISGYAIYARARGSFGDRSHGCAGEITELYIAPEYQGLGIGELLFEGCRARLDQKGYRGLVVWALRDNAQAIEFYKRRGGFIGKTAWGRVGASTLRKVALFWD